MSRFSSANSIIPNEPENSTMNQNLHEDIQESINTTKENEVIFHATQEHKGKDIVVKSLKGDKSFMK